jgi:SAM-dependent methyltransferase
MAWDHGYHSHTAYTCGYFRELAPNWIDLAALLKGHASPRRSEGEVFTYLELGSGMGLGLCLLAAAYPEGSFLGVDFQPDHIAHATRLAADLGLANVRFLEADFLRLQEDPSPLGPAVAAGGGFQYVVAHGIATWVTPAVQEALLAVAAAALVPGGVFYCSYNTFPGWLARTAFQKLYWLEQGRSDPTDPAAAFRQASARLRLLLGSTEAPSPLGSALPQLGAELAWIEQDRADYLCGEYANEGWAPLYVADMHQRCARHKLRHLGTATLPEAFEQLLAPSLQGALQEETNPLLRQSLLDLATNKAFRRDLFVKGLQRTTGQDLDGFLAGLRVVPLDPRPDLDPGQETPEFEFATSFGQVVGDPAVYAPIDRAIRAGHGCGVAELVEQSSEPTAEVLLVLALFLDAGRIGLDRGKAGARAAAGAQRCNAVLLRYIQGGRPYGHLVAPAIGSALPISSPEVLVQAAHADGLVGPMLSTCVLLGLEQLNVELLTPDKQPCPDADTRLKRMEDLAASYLNGRLPTLQRLGALPKLRRR